MRARGLTQNLGGRAQISALKGMLLEIEADVKRFSNPNLESTFVAARKDIEAAIAAAESELE